MSYNGSGVFNINTAGQPVVTGTVISSTAFNALTADLGTGLSTAITKNGQTTVTANIPFNGFKLTGIGVATASGDALTYGQAATVTTLVASTSITDSGLTSGRVTYASTGGLLADSAALTWDGTTLAATKFSGALNGTVGATTPSTGAFTTLSATKATAGDVITWTATGSRTGYLYADATYIGLMDIAGAGAGNGLLISSANTYFQRGGSTIANISSAGLAVTGTLTSTLDATHYGVTVGRGGGAVSTNTVLGNAAFASNLTGGYSVAIGTQALQVSTAGYNTAVGYQSQSLTNTGQSNVSVGYYSLVANLSGGSNTAIGTFALTSNTNASGSTAVGYKAGYTNTGIVTAFGYQAGYSQTTNATYQNSFFGYEAGYFATGAGHTAVGHNALRAMTSNNWSTAVGYNALAADTGGTNTAVGSQAAQLTTGSSNTVMGYAVLATNISGTDNVAIGYQALYTTTTGSQVAVGSRAAYSRTVSTGETYASTFVGTQAGYGATSAIELTYLGGFAGRYQTGNYNTAVGSAALYGASGTSTGTSNTALGYVSLFSNTSGSTNVALGGAALYSNTTASNNTAVGYQAGYTNQTGTRSVLVGATAGYAATALDGDTHIGFSAGSAQTTGFANTFVGSRGNAANNEGAGKNVTTGTYNTFIGGSAGGVVTTGSKNTILGNYAGNSGGLDIRTASNYVVLSDGDGNIVASSKTAQTFALQGGTLSTGTGIAFPATQSASTDANTLDDYEEGTWTPSIGGTATYTYQTGRYTKIGRMVYVSAIFQVNVIGTGSTSQITGLPFSGASGYVGAEASFSVSYFSSIASNVVTLYANATSASVQFYGLTAAAGSVAAISPFQNTTRIDFSGWYIAAN